MLRRDDKFMKLRMRARKKRGGFESGWERVEIDYEKFHMVFCYLIKIDVFCARQFEH